MQTTAPHESRKAPIDSERAGTYLQSVRNRESIQFESYNRISRKIRFHSGNVHNGLKKNESANVSDDYRFHPRSIFFDFESTADDPGVEVERLMPAALGNKRSAPLRTATNPG